MKIKNQLALSYLIIFSIFILNLFGFFLSNYQRNKVVESLRQAISRQLILSSVKLEFSNMVKQMAMLSEVFDENSKYDESEFNLFKAQLKSIIIKLNELKGLSDVEILPQVNNLLKNYSQLEKSWQKVFKELGTDYSEAITELNVTSNPLSSKIMQELLPDFEKKEKLRVEMAEKNYKEVESLLNKLAIYFFLGSLLLSVLVAYRFSDNINKKLTVLKEGVEIIGKGQLEHKIKIDSTDELSTLAKEFNNMADNISSFIELQKKRQAEIEEAKQKAIEEANIRKLMDIEIEKHRSISMMVAGVAHEINTPLGIVNTAASYISGIMTPDVIKSMSDSEETEEILTDVSGAIELIQKNIKRANKLIQNFKKISVSQINDKIAEVNLYNEIVEIVDLAKINLKQSKFEIKIINEPGGESGIWIGYPGCLSQILMNLLANIERYAYPEHTGGKVEIIISEDNNRKPPYFILTVRDFGVGISAENLPKIFDAFFTTGHGKGGSGLGLALVYNFVTSGLKGTIEIKSALGEGTTFIINFPKVIAE